MFLPSLRGSGSWCALLILALTLSACSVTASPSAPTIIPAQGHALPSARAAAPTLQDRSVGAPVIVTFGAEENDRQVYEPLIEAFNTDHPDMFVQLVPLDATARLHSSSPAIVERSMRMIASSADTFALTLPKVEHTTSPLLRDLIPLIDADPTLDRADFYPAALPVGSSALRIMPLRIDVPLLSYNKDLWAAHQLPAPSPEWTWSDLLDSAAQLVDKNNVTVETYGLLNDWDGRSATVALLGHLRATGVNISSSTARLDQPHVVQALDQVAMLVQNGTIAVPLVTNQRPAEDVEALIREGQGALWPADQWLDYFNQLPYTTGVAPYPPGPLPAPRLILGVAMSAGTQHPNEAWRWMAFLSRQNVAAPTGTALGPYVVPTRKSIAESNGGWQALDAETVAAMQTALMRPVSADQPLDQALAAALTEALVAVLKDGRPADEALQTAQGHFVQAVAEITKPAPSSRPVIVSTPIPTPAIPVTRIRFDPGVSNSWAIPEVVQQFNRQHEDIEVTVVQPSPRDDSSIEASARRSDCFVQWRPFSFGEPMQTESVRDLQPLIDADASFPHDDYLPGLFEPFKRDGKLLGLPHDLRLLGIGYNKTLFDAVGQEYPRADWTLDDFLRAAERLTTGDGNKRVYGFGEPWGNPGSDFLINQAGASLLIGSGDRVKPNFTDPKVIGALQTYIDLLRNTSPQTRMLNFDPSQQLRKANDLRNQGRIGMWFSADKPRRYIGLDPSVTLAMAPAPMSSYAPTPSDLWLSGFYISAQAPDPEACWTFGLFLNTNVLAITEYGSPTRISVGESSAYAAAEPEGVVIWQAHRAALNRPPVPNQQASWINDIELTGRYWLDRALDRALQGKALDKELMDAQFYTEQYLQCTQSGEAAITCAQQVDPSYEGYPER